MKYLFIALGVLFWVSRAEAQLDDAIYKTPFVFHSFAGKAGRMGSSDGQGSAALFSNPSSVAVDGSGNVYVADTINETIRKITPAGLVSTLAGQAGVSGSSNGQGILAKFYRPSALDADTGGTVYVADTYNHTIRKITPAGVVSTLAGQAGVSGNIDGKGSAARFNYPSGIAVDGSHNVYVADTFNQTIRKINPAGVVSTLVSRLPYPLFKTPMGIAVDGKGNVFVADYGDATIRKVDPAGAVTYVAGRPGDIGSDDSIDPLPGSSAGLFSGPYDIAVDAGGNLFVADAGNRTIRMITPGGTVTTVAGLAGMTGNANGTGEKARFDDIRGLAVDSSGKLYAAEAANETIRVGTIAVPPWITSASSAGGTYLAAFRYQITASPFPAGYVLAGTLPSGLKFTAKTGLLSGAPTQGGTFTVKVGATNAKGTGTQTLKLTIAPIKQTIAFPAVAAHTFGDAPFALSATASSGLPVSFSVVSGPATVSGKTLTLTGGGVVTVQATQAGNANYLPAPAVSETILVLGKAQTITFPALADRAFTTVQFTLNATASSGLPVSYTSSGPVSIVGNVAIVTGAGKVVIQADQVGNASYLQAPSVRQTFMVTAGAQTIAFPAIGDKVLGTKPFALSATASSGLPITYTAYGAATISGNVVTLTGVGAVRITADQAGNATYLAAPEVAVKFNVVAP